MNFYKITSLLRMIKVFLLGCMMIANSSAIAGIFGFLSNDNFCKLQKAQFYSGAAVIFVGACLAEARYKSSGQAVLEIGGGAMASAMAPMIPACLLWKLFDLNLPKSDPKMTKNENTQKICEKIDRNYQRAHNVKNVLWALSLPVMGYGLKTWWSR